MTVVWVYLNPIDEWTSRLAADVESIVASTDDFPNYSTFTTELSATEFSLLSNQTAWALACDPSAEIITELFTS